MARKKKQKHLYTKKEFFFNFFSLIIIIGIGIYFGYRSLYYYSKQNMVNKGNNQNLGEVIINSNKLVTEGDGFHRDKKGYYFTGKVSNNYVLFANRVFRIIRINNDGSIKLVTDRNIASFMWGDADTYKNSNLYNWLDKREDKHTGIYYNTIPAADNFLVKTNYSEDILKDDKIVLNNEENSDYITTLTIDDYVISGGKNGYLNNGQIYHLLGLNDSKGTLYVEEDGSIANSDSLTSYGVKAVITLKKNTISSYGDGSVDNPYTIKQGNNTNYVDRIVKLGEDNWKVFQEENDILKLVKVDYIKNKDNREFKYRFSEEENTFDLEDWKGLAVYLNNSYLNSLSYKNILERNNYYTGEISTDTGYNLENNYADKVNCKVGLLNIFDYNNSDYDDIYLMNPLGGTLRYIKYKNGLLGEAEITDEKHVIPVVSINKKHIKSGKGTLKDPYITG